MKRCLNCDTPLTGLRDANRRKYCSRPCLSTHRTSAPRNVNTGHQQAQRMVRGLRCLRCGATPVEAHHKDRNPLNNAPRNIEAICRTCHKAEHSRPLRLSTCAVCTVQFRAASHRNRSKLCGAAMCAAEWGRRCAMRRWAKTVSDACAVTATLSSPRKRKSSSKK